MSLRAVRNNASLAERLAPAATYCGQGADRCGSRLRIVSLAPAATEMICGMGLHGQLVGVSHECNWPAEVSALPRVTRSNIDSTASSGEIDWQVKELLKQNAPLYALDATSLAQLQPDLILAQSQCAVCAVSDADIRLVIDSTSALRKVNVLTLHPQSLDETIADIRRIGAAAGAEAAAESFGSRLQERADCVRSAVDDRRPASRPRVAVIEWIDPLMVAGNWVPEMVVDAGGQYALATARMPSRYALWEEIVEYQPELLVIAPCGFDLQRSQVEAEALKHLPHWDSLPAVAEGCVYVVDGDAYFNRPGPRQVDALESLALAVGSAIRHSPDKTWQRPLPLGWRLFHNHAHRRSG